MSSSGHDASSLPGDGGGELSGRQRQIEVPNPCEQIPSCAVLLQRGTNWAASPPAPDHVCPEVAQLTTLEYAAGHTHVWQKPQSRDESMFATSHRWWMHWWPLPVSPAAETEWVERTQREYGKAFALEWLPALGLEAPWPVMLGLVLERCEPSWRVQVLCPVRRVGTAHPAIVRLGWEDERLGSHEPSDWEWLEPSSSITRLLKPPVLHNDPALEAESALWRWYEKHLLGRTLSNLGGPPKDDPYPVVRRAVQTAENFFRQRKKPPNLREVAREIGYSEDGLSKLFDRGHTSWKEIRRPRRAGHSGGNWRKVALRRGIHGTCCNRATLYRRKQCRCLSPRPTARRLAPG